MLKLDHLAVVCADLDVGSAWLETQLGVSLQTGGQHDHFATHNRLLGLADGLYLEVIAPNPNATVDRPRWFNLDHAPQQPCLANWICQAENPAAFADTAGPTVDLQRGDLTWQITVPSDGSLPFGGGFPTLIKWGNGVPHPSTTLAPSGLSLTRLDVGTPDALQITAALGKLDDRVCMSRADTVTLRATFDTPNGPKVLG